MYCQHKFFLIYTLQIIRDMFQKMKDDDTLSQRGTESLNTRNNDRNEFSQRNQHLTKQCKINIISEREYYIIQMLLGFKLVMKMYDIKEQLKKNMKEDCIFGPFEKRGICSQILFSYNNEPQKFQIAILKDYFYHVLNQRQFELLIIAKQLVTTLDQFFDHLGGFCNYIKSNPISPKTFQITNIDIISITIKREFETWDLFGKPITRTFYLRESSFEFKKNLVYFRSKEADRLFCFTQFQLHDANRPNAHQFYLTPRLNFIDDLHSNESLLKRFTFRFLSFYHPFSLYNKQVAAKTPYLREFYRKVHPYSYFYAIRMKKLGFVFPLRKPLKQTKQSKEAKESTKQRTKIIKASIYLYCFDKETEKEKPGEKPIQYPNTHSIHFFYIETMFPEISEKLASEAFNNRLNRMQWGKNKSPFIFDRNHKLKIDPKIEECYCKLLCQFSFFLDRIFLLMLDNFRQNKRRYPEEPKQFILKASLEEQSCKVRLPQTEQYSLKGSKYVFHYQLEVKNRRYYQQHQSMKDDNMDKMMYENEIQEVRMFRRKRTVEADIDNQFTIFQRNPDKFKGFKQYMNRLINCWNLRDIYQEASDFAAGYMENILDKNSEKISPKSMEKWPTIYEAIERLFQSLSQTFFTSNTAIKLYILSQQTQQNRAEIDESLLLFHLTFSFYELNLGWTETLPPCLYHIRITKREINFGLQMEQKVKMSIDASKKSMSSKIKKYLLQTNENQCQFPFMEEMKENSVQIEKMERIEDEEEA